MPSTYSPDLRIELIATGEQAGTWGTTTNTNLGTLIEDAIAGYTSVSITSADQALTASNGAADQARNMIVNLTTTTSANFNVYVPPANKFYVIRNSSAYQATIFCSTTLGNTTAAGTGVAIPASRETIVFSDGTNIVSATDYLPALSLGTDLAVADGGTGASDAPTARTNLGTVSDPGSNGMLARTSANTTTARTITASTGITVSNGDGVAGNPTITNSGVTSIVAGTGISISGGTGAVTVNASGGGGFSNMQVFASSGTFTIPTGITKVKVTVVGGGGGGGSATGSGCCPGPTIAAGGGGGGAAIEIVSGLTPGNTVSVTVGGGGGAASAGGTSSFGAFCSATGGAGGASQNNNTQAAGTSGGIGSGGDLNIRGGPGCAPNYGGLNNLTGTSGGNSILGGGGQAGLNNGGTAGGAYGGGGAGAAKQGGGTVGGSSGAAGVVIVEY